MAGLVAVILFAIHVLLVEMQLKDVDARDKRGHDAEFPHIVMAGHSCSKNGVLRTPMSRPSTSCRLEMMKSGYIYIMTNRRDGTLYVGVTNDLIRRCHEHRNGLLRGFTKRYALKQLVYFEQYDDIRLAIQREKTIKHWTRAWKARLIHAQNPEWRDLFETIV